MKINISELGLKEITFSDLLGWFDEEEIEEIKKEILDNGSYYDEFIDFEKEDDSDTIEGTLSTGHFEIIDRINEMKICLEDPFIMIVKDSLRIILDYLRILYDSLRILKDSLSIFNDYIRILKDYLSISNDYLRNTLILCLI